MPSCQLSSDHCSFFSFCVMPHWCEKPDGICVSVYEYCIEHGNAWSWQGGGRCLLFFSRHRLVPGVYYPPWDSICLAISLRLMNQRLFGIRQSPNIHIYIYISLSTAQRGAYLLQLLRRDGTQRRASMSKARVFSGLNRLWLHMHVSARLSSEIIRYTYRPRDQPIDATLCG